MISNLDSKIKCHKELAATPYNAPLRRLGNSGLLFGGVILDLSKAFDILEHGRLPGKRKSNGFDWLALNSFTAYLFQRSKDFKLILGLDRAPSWGPLFSCYFPMTSSTKYVTLIPYSLQMTW